MSIEMHSEMEYKGHTGRCEIDLEAGIIYGRVIGIDDVVTFQGESVKDAIEAFHESVDDYLDLCLERDDPADPDEAPDPYRDDSSGYVM